MGVFSRCYLCQPKFDKLFLTLKHRRTEREKGRESERGKVGREDHLDKAE